MRKIGILLSIVLLFVGCASIKPSEIIRTEPRYYIIPEIGVETTVHVGDYLIKEGMTTARDAIFLNNDHGRVGWTAFHPSGFYILIGKDGDDLIYQHRSIMPGMLSTVYPQIIMDTNNNVYLNVISGRKLLENNEYSKRQYVEESGNNFEQTLIYTGLEGNILRFSYREFFSNTARPAFSLDVTYDMRTGNIIRFRGASLEIINANNQSITYKVLSGFTSN